MLKHSGMMEAKSEAYWWTMLTYCLFEGSDAFSISMWIRLQNLLKQIITYSFKEIYFGLIILTIQLFQSLDTVGIISCLQIENTVYIYNNDGSLHHEVNCWKSAAYQW